MYDAFECVSIDDIVAALSHDTSPLLGAGDAGARAGAASAGRLLSRGHCAGGAPLELLSAFYVKMIILPRQARDKHRESAQK